MKINNNPPGVTITSPCMNTDNEESFLRVGSLVGMHINFGNDEAKITRIVTSKGAKFVLSSVCIDAPEFGPFDQAKLMIRFIDEDTDQRNDWVCLSNFLGKKRGGRSLPCSSPINLEAVGPCIIELAAWGALENGSIQVLGNVVAVDPCQFYYEYSISEKATSKNCCKGIGCKGYFKRYPFRIMLGILMLISFICQGDGGFTRPSPSLRQTERRTLSVASKSSKGPRSLSMSTGSSESAPSASLSPASSDSSLFGSPSVVTPKPSSATFSEAVFNESQFLSNNCINLTVAVLPYNLELYPLKWSIHKIVDGNDILSWENAYSNPELTNKVILEQSNGSNSTKKPICLSPGNYTFRFDIGYDVFAISSGGTLISCGEFLENEVEFSLPYLSKSPVSSVNPGSNQSECPRMSCHDEESVCLKKAMTPVQCYGSGKEWNGGDRTALFSDTCSIALNNACQSGSFGFTYDDVIADFCPYFQCANPAYQKYLNGDSIEEYNGCECLYSQWSSPKSEERQCCIDGSNGVKEESNIALSCQCSIEPKCEGGDAKMCDISMEYCCPKKDYTERNACELTALEIKCPDSVEQKNTSADGTYPYCHQAITAQCQDDIDAPGCACSYWESLCKQFPEAGVCEDAVNFCCIIRRSSSWCACDFYTWALDFGYTSQKMRQKCSEAASRTSRGKYEEEGKHLKSLYNSLGGEYWFNNTGWMTNNSHCHWFGVTCNDVELVSELRLGNNNLTGELTFVDGDGTWYLCGMLWSLELLDLSKNNIYGIIESWNYYDLRLLTHVDLSENNLSGVADVLLSPAIRLANFSHNSLSSVTYMIVSRAAYTAVEIFDLSYNIIKQNADDVMKDLPPNLKELIISDNSIYGTFPKEFPVLRFMKRLIANNNYISGPLFNLPHTVPLIATLNLSTQKRNGVGGLTGSIPTDISSLVDLTELDLSHNDLTGSIPATIGNIRFLKLLDVSNNNLKGEIPRELGALSDISEVLDLSSNGLSGSIPLEFKDFTGGLIRLSNNTLLSGPAPLSLCYDVPGFDLKGSTRFCPAERNALYDIFVSAKGPEWTHSSGWGDQFENPCSWYGIRCDERHQPIEMNLTNNGLAGILDSKIGTLYSLEMIDLSDNDIMGSVPEEIANLAKLSTLRISYNSFTGSIPNQLNQLQNLKLVQLQSNRFVGEVHIHLNPKVTRDPSSLISDCGVPTDFDKPLICVNCTICCNIRSECHTTTLPVIIETDTPGLRSWADFTWLFLLSLLACFFVWAFVTYQNNKRRKMYARRLSLRGHVFEEKKLAWGFIGDDSVYCFFLTKSWRAWLAALSVITFQFMVFMYFVWASEKEFSNDKSDFVYSWRCPRNSIECSDTDDITKFGWFIFAVLMMSHLAKDIVNGLKLINMSTKEWHHRNRRIRYFFGGVCLVLISAFAIYATTVYNIAIARSNPELIASAVIVLFITDVDEQIYGFIETACPRWLDGLKELVNEPRVIPNTEKCDDELETTQNMTPRLEGTQHEPDQGFSDIEAKLHDVVVDMNAKLTQMKLEILESSSRASRR
ncbi:hypothetical protein HJC23_008875 [Cyclotella cryptica]|uniref:Leucine-rich repeat-containing N-terminal plant-type domain-containing protein n=1 Tax=Cyclotella cryptica TaxID=29204 RepID=A0ABD3PDM6_9STRA